MSDPELLREVLPLLIPILVIQLLLIVFALRDLMGRKHLRGPRWLWVLLIIFGNMLGPILYFVLARDDE